MKVYLGIDLGTSYFKAALFNERGKLMGLGRRPVKKETGDGNLSELPVSVFWKTLNSCISEALQNAKIKADKIEAVSYSSQTNSFILLDKNNNPLTPLILWPDKRAENSMPKIRSLWNRSDFLEKTGLGIEPDNQFCIAKIDWVQKKQPELWKQVGSLLSISDYLTFNLTGRKVADISTHSLTGLLDVTLQEWWNDAINLFSLTTEILPELKPAGSFVGNITLNGAKLIGINSGTPYFLGALDHHCAATGSGVVQVNSICESTGTVLACVAYTKKYLPKQNCCTAPGLNASSYFQMAFNENGAHTLEWYQKKFAPEFTIPELLELAAKVNKNCDGLIALPAAYKFPGLDGFKNRKPLHQHGHFVKAILNSTSESLSKLIELLKGGDFPGDIISTGGGAQSTLWVKIKAARLKRKFYIPECNETACLGAAMIAAKGVTKLKNSDEITDNWIRFKKVINPD